MLTFEMNAGNFETYLGGGTADGTRVTGDGVELDLCEHAGDADTLGLWHLHDEVWADASGHGVDLDPVNGPTLGAEGATFVRASGQYATAALGLQAHGEHTVECWFRLADLPGSGESYYLLSQYYNVRLYVYEENGNHILRYRVREDDGEGGYAEQNAAYTWAGIDTALHHVEATWKQGVAIELRLDGVLVASDVALTGNGLAYAGTTFHLAAQANNGNTFNGLIDELRVSSTRRHTANFTPSRYLASGTFTSPAFDTERLDSAWLALAWQAETPGTTGLAMHVCSGDELDGGGQVVGEWQAADEAPEPGRYLQWRATLARSTDALGLQTPTVESVTAVASEAGYNLYAGAGQQAWAIDYAAPIARLGPGAVSHSVAALAYPAVHWFGLRSANADGLESKTIDAEVRLELDADGQAVPARPAPVESLEAAGAGAGKVCLQWLALGEMGEAPADVFRVYSNGGAGDVDFNTPLGEVACVEGLRQYEWTSEAFDDGLAVTFVVRAETDEGGVDADPAEVEIEIDAAPPAAVGFLAAAPALDD